MRKTLSIIALSLLASNVQAAQRFVAVVNVPVAAPAPTPTPPPADERLEVVKDSVLATTGTYQAVGTTLLNTNNITTSDGCEVELTGDLTSGTFEYIDTGCSDTDEVVFTAANGMTQTVPFWNAQDCDLPNNEWLRVADAGTDSDLIYNSRSCSLNGSTLRAVWGLEEVPATWLKEIDIQDNIGYIFTHGLQAAYWEGSAPQFKLNRIKSILGDVNIDHSFLSDVDFSKLIWMTGTEFAITSFDSRSSAQEISLPKLRQFGTNIIDFDFSGSSSINKVDIPLLTKIGDLDLTYTSVTDISNLAHLTEAYIISTPVAMFPQFDEITVYPANNTPFCQGVRDGTIIFDTADTETLAVSACTL